MNVGDGVPCTIQHLDGKRIEPEENIETKKDATHRQFKKRMVEFASKLKEDQAKAKDIIKKKTLSKEDQHTLNWFLEKITQEVTSNIPFFMECFQEVADKVVLEAKAEVEVAIMRKVTILGLEELKNQNKLLSDGK
jgi:hypothetical protein